MQEGTERRLAAEALDRLARGALPEADAVKTVDVGRYTCTDALVAEKATLFRHHPLPLAFGCEIAEPGDYLTLEVAGVPVLLMRGDDGTVRGLLNTCRHRGARLLDGAGRAGKTFLCPYHNWAYGRCGTLRAQTASEHFPDIAVGETGLVRFPTEERHGLVWLLLDPSGTLDLDAALGSLGPELAAFGLEGYRHHRSHVSTRRMNWKLGMDSSLECYHVPFLHRESVGNVVLGPVFLFEALGRHSRLVLPLPGILRQQGRDPETHRLVPYANISYRLFPNTLFISRGPRVELVCFFPDPERPDRAQCRSSFAWPADDDCARDREGTIRFVLRVRDEDLSVMEGVQANLAAGVQREVVFGRNEIGLHNFHEVRDAALAGQG